MINYITKKYHKFSKQIKNDKEVCKYFNLGSLTLFYLERSPKEREAFRAARKVKENLNRVQNIEDVIIGATIPFKIYNQKFNSQ